MDLGEGGDGPEAKRRKAFTKRETLQRLEELGDNVSKAVSEMVSEIDSADIFWGQNRIFSGCEFFFLYVAYPDISFYVGMGYGHCALELLGAFLPVRPIWGQNDPFKAPWE